MNKYRVCVNNHCDYIVQRRWFFIFWKTLMRGPGEYFSYIIDSSQWNDVRIFHDKYSAREYIHDLEDEIERKKEKFTVVKD